LYASPYRLAQAEASSAGSEQIQTAQYQRVGNHFEFFLTLKLLKNNLIKFILFRIMYVENIVNKMFVTSNA
jgi:hypothetical protein